MSRCWSPSGSPTRATAKSWPSRPLQASEPKRGVACCRGSSNGASRHQAGDLRRPRVDQDAVKVELPGAAWQRCTVHFQRNVLVHVPQAESKAVASDLKVIFQAARRETAEALAASFAERYGARYSKAVSTLTGGLDEALTYTTFPSSHHRLIRTTNGLERAFREVKRRTRVVGVFPNEQSAETLATAVLLRVSEDWCSGSTSTWPPPPRPFSPTHRTHYSTPGSGPSTPS